jgi:hypothetical protein
MATLVLVSAMMDSVEVRRVVGVGRGRVSWPGRRGRSVVKLSSTVVLERWSIR